MRFSLEHTVGAGGIEHTILLNLSETGAGFVVERQFAPKVGDRIKVEVPIPQGDRIAWWGEVVRTSAYQPRGWFKNDGFNAENRVFVALHFEALPEPHSRDLRRGLNRSFIRAMRDQKFRNVNYYYSVFLENFWRFLLLAFLTAVVFGTLYALTLPSSTYDPKRGAPWGERFKFF